MQLDMASRTARASVRGVVPMEQPIPTNSMSVAIVWLWSIGHSLTRRRTAKGSSFQLKDAYPDNHGMMMTWTTHWICIHSDMVFSSTPVAPASEVRGFKVGSLLWLPLAMFQTSWLPWKGPQVAAVQISSPLVLSHWTLFNECHLSRWQQ